MKFTGKQITLMVVAVSAATILTPAAVNAATGSSVNITDPVYSANKARVTGGKLYVGDGYGPMTVDGLVKVSDGSGALTVDGSVVANEPATVWSVGGSIANNGTDQVLIKDLAANAGVAIGSITVSQTAGTGPTQVWLRAFHPTTAGNCSAGTFQADVAQFSVPQDDTRTISYTPRFRVPKQASESCLFLFVAGGGTHTVSVTATGTTY